MVTSKGHNKGRHSSNISCVLSSGKYALQWRMRFLSTFSMFLKEKMPLNASNYYWHEFLKKIWGILKNSWPLSQINLNVTNTKYGKNIHEVPATWLFAWQFWKTIPEFSQRLQKLEKENKSNKIICKGILYFPVNWKINKSMTPKGNVVGIPISFYSNF